MEPTPSLQEEQREKSHLWRVGLSFQLFIGVHFALSLCSSVLFPGRTLALSSDSRTKMTRALKSNHECCLMCQFIFPLWLLLSFHPFTSFPVVPGPPPPSPCSR